MHFILEVVDAADASGLPINHRGAGSKQSPSARPLTLLVCFCTKVRSSPRVIEDASYYDVSVCYLCTDRHPDHGAICTFHCINPKAFKKLFRQCYLGRVGRFFKESVHGQRGWHQDSRQCWWIQCS